MIRRLIELINKNGRQGPKDLRSVEVYSWIKNKVKITYEEYIELIKEHTIKDIERECNRDAYFVEDKDGKITFFKSNEEEIRKYACYIVRENPHITSAKAREKFKIMYQGYTIIDLMNQKNLSSKQDVIDQTFRNILVSNYFKKKNNILFNRSEKRPFTYTITQKGRELSSYIDNVINIHKENDYIDESVQIRQLLEENIGIYTEEELKEIKEKNKNFNLLDKYPDLEKYKGRFPTDVKIKNTRFYQTCCKCEVDSSHITFKTETLPNFVEGHHGVPMAVQKNFPLVNIDCIENMVALCPNCHSKITYGTREEKLEVFNIILDKREEDLKSIGFTREMMRVIFDTYY